MSISPARGDGIVLRGTFCCCGTPPSAKEICDCYELEITVFPSFPRKLPSVREVAGRIPRDVHHHTYCDGSLCLGSEIRLRLKLCNKPTLVGFAELCLVPYLCAMSRTLSGSERFPFGELAHGIRGIFDDYKSIFGLASDVQILAAIELLGMKRRIANKNPCPCGCGLRVGRCRLHLRLSKYRKIASRKWFKDHLNYLKSIM